MLFVASSQIPHAIGTIGTVPIRHFAVFSIVSATHLVNSFVFNAAKTTIHMSAMPKKLIMSRERMFPISAHVCLNACEKFNSTKSVS